jgi:hypothetical protein
VARSYGLAHFPFPRFQIRFCSLPASSPPSTPLTFCACIHSKKLLRPHFVDYCLPLGTTRSLHRVAGLHLVSRPCIKWSLVCSDIPSSSSDRDNEVSGGTGFDVITMVRYALNPHKCSAGSNYDIAADLDKRCPNPPMPQLRSCRCSTKSPCAPCSIPLASVTT